MRRMATAGLLGAMLSLVASFFTVAVISAIGGVPIPYEPDRYVYGWEAAQLGMMFFILVGLINVWPFPALAIFGAAVGLLVQRRRDTTHSFAQSA